METQAWLDHALDRGYLERKRYRSLDDSWQKVGAMLDRMIQRARTTFAGQRASSERFPGFIDSSIFDPRSSILF